MTLFDVLEKKLTYKRNLEWMEKRPVKKEKLKEQKKKIHYLTQAEKILVIFYKSNASIIVLHIFKITMSGSDLHIRPNCLFSRGPSNST